MHTTILTTTTLALLSLGSFATADHGNMPKQNHASFVRVKRGGPTLHLIGDETVAKWSGGGVPNLPVVQATIATSATTTWNLLDSINAGLGAPIGKATSTSSSSSSSSQSSSSASVTSSPVAAAKVKIAAISTSSEVEAQASSTDLEAEPSSSSSHSKAAAATLALTRGSKAGRSIVELGVVAEDASEEHIAALGRRAVGNGTVTLGLGRAARIPTSSAAATVPVTSAASAASSATDSSSSSSSSTSSAASADATPVISGADLVTPQGWGGPFSNKYTTMSVKNHAVKGASARAIVRDLWSTSILSTIKAGDVVVIQLGHADGGMPGNVADIAKGCVASVPGLGSETMTVTGCDGKQEVVQTYGTYVSQMCASVQSKGATCVISSMTPKNEWRRANTMTYNSPYVGYAKNAAAAAGAIYIPHEEAIAMKMNADGPTTSTSYYIAGGVLQPNAGGADAFAATFAAAAHCSGASSITSAFTAAGQAMKGQYC